MIEKVTDNFMERILQEQDLRDRAMGVLGDFAENALLESLYRYWLESTLATLGFSAIHREALYPGNKAGRGRKMACDLHCTHSGNPTWIELKVAYEDTGYTDAELLSDFERLETVKNASKMYITVFITPGDMPCRKMNIMQEKAKSMGARSTIKSHRIPTPWKKWINAHIHVTAYLW